MADGVSIEWETKEVQDMMQRLLNKVERPKPLLKNMQRMIRALTKKMFVGRRPDTSGVRGVKWPRLQKSTIDRKKQLKKKGRLHGGAAPARPMVEQGTMRDSVKVLEENPLGFVFGTRVKSKKGFPYPGYHNANKFSWLFLSKGTDFAQLSIMTKDYLDNQMKRFSAYVKG
jgi:phage gpG-like protein